MHSRCMGAVKVFIFRQSGREIQNKRQNTKNTMWVRTIKTNLDMSLGKVRQEYI